MRHDGEAIVLFQRHGEEKLRQVAGVDGLRYENSQRTQTFFEQQFRVRLSVGEMVIVTADDAAAGKLGELFFCGPQALAIPQEDSAEVEPVTAPRHSPDVQRLLVVRVAGMTSPPPPPEK